MSDEATAVEARMTEALYRVYALGGVKSQSELIIELERLLEPDRYEGTENDRAWLAVDAEAVIAHGVAHGMLRHRSAGIAFRPTQPTEEGRTILAEAEALVNGERQINYGPPIVNFANVAAIWSVILGTEVTPRQVCLCMAGLKLARAGAGDGHRDSLVDAVGYLRIIELMGMAG